MWKKEDVKPQGAIRETPPAQAPIPVPLASSTPAHSAAPAAVPLPVSPRAAACISQGIRIKGEVSGSEDLFVDGQVEGKLSLSNGSLTVGPNGSVKADLNAREVIVRGTVEGKVSGRDRVQLWSTGRVNGEVQTERLAIEEGAVLRGRVEAGKSTGRAAESRAAAVSASVSAKVAETKPISSETAAD